MAVLAGGTLVVSGAVAIFVKTPGWSALKTRLATGTGESYAQEWYRRAADAVASVAARARSAYGLAAYWAVAEDGAESAWTGLPTIAQGAGDLGTRMARVHSTLVERHGFAMLIGADAPQLSVDAIARAADWLDNRDSPEPRQVLGPATDGGFWLYGGNRAIPAHAWRQVPYSQSDTATRFRQAMQDYGCWQTLEQLTDADRAADLKPVQHALDLLADPTAEQRRLAQWMRESTRLATSVDCS